MAADQGDGGGGGMDGPAPVRWLAGLSETWRGAVLVVAILTAGISVGIGITGWYGLPSRFRALERIQAAADSTQRDLATQVAGVKFLIRQQVCLSIADRQHTPWENCLIKP